MSSEIKTSEVFRSVVDDICPKCGNTSLPHFTGNSVAVMCQNPECKHVVERVADVKKSAPLPAGEVSILKTIEAETRALPKSEDDVRLRPTWLPITTAPHDVEVLVGVYIAEVWIVRGARWVGATEWMPNHHGEVDGWWSYRNSMTQEILDGPYAPTHWAPMPDPPKAK